MRKTNTLLLCSGIVFVFIWLHSLPSAGSGWDILADEAAELLRTEQYDAALITANKALENAEKNDGPGQLDVAKSLSILSEIHLRMGNSSEAERDLVRALTIREKVLRPDHSAIIQNLDDLAYLYTLKENHASAEPIYERLVALVETSTTDQEDLFWRLEELAANYSKQSKWLEAEPLLVRSLAIRESELDEDSIFTANTMLALAEVFRATNRIEKANSFQERADAILDPEPSTFEKVKRYVSLAIGLILFGYIAYLFLGVIYCLAKESIQRRFRPNLDRTEIGQ